MAPRITESSVNRSRAALLLVLLQQPIQAGVATDRSGEAVAGNVRQWNSVAFEPGQPYRTTLRSKLQARGRSP